MAKPGDVVEFRSGLHGIEAPRNLGILVDRQRRKGVPWVRLVTVEGEKEIKAEHLSRRAFKQRYEGSLRDVEEVRARLRFLVQQHTAGQLAEEAEDDLARLEEEMWEATCDAGHDAWTDEEVAAALYGDASPVQIKQARAALDRCRRPGTGRFETVGRGDAWRPWTRDQREAMGRAWQALHDLRGRLVETVETEEGRAFLRVELDRADLTETDRATLAWVKAAMVQYVEHDGVPAAAAGRIGDDGFENGVAGIGGLGAARAFSMDLHRMLAFLAQDWIRSEHTTTSSDYVHFLLESGLWSPDDAVAGLTRRHVNQEPFFEHVPDGEAEAAADALPRPDLAQDPARTDLREKACYTIDPPDAKDFDDAVGIEDLGGGRTRLWVHIADVAHYVRPGTVLDRHARKRATSVYLPGRVLPMLPHRIADDLCSLRDDGDRFAMSVALDVSADGVVEASLFHRSIVRVTENLAYDEALRRAQAGQAPFPALLDLAGRMRRHRRGLALETGELKVLLEESGFSALEKRADDATRMIETFMVAANEAVAGHLGDAGVGMLYRCHPLPDAQRAERFRHQLATMGLDVGFELPERARAAAGGAGQSLLDRLKAGGGRLELFGGGAGLVGGDEGPEDEGGEEDEEELATGFAALPEEEREAWLAPFRAAVDAIADLPDAGRAEVTTLKLLGCMGQAYYSPRNEGHFGLASTHYGHFTSPIRRYPDLVVHRHLAWLLGGREGDPPHGATELDALASHCSDQERAADGLERRIRSSCLVLASLTGDAAFATSRARITGLTPTACFVRLENGIEARVPARELPGGPYQVDEWESMLFVSDVEAPQRFDPEDLSTFRAWYDEETGETRRVRARLADPVQMRLAGRNVADGKTDARITAWRR